MRDIAVVLPAYLPPREHLDATLGALQRQTLARDRWEFVIVDNSPAPSVGAEAAVWHPHGRVVREEKPGLVAARQAGFQATRAPVIVVVDQDNVLAPDFLAQCLAVASQHPTVGAWGAGMIVPVFERPELAPPPSLHSLLTLRETRAAIWSRDPDDHTSTPWGAGLCLRREVADAHARALAENPLKGALDLRGDLRLSGGDTDLAYTACALGMDKGVFPQLQLQHLIPASRCQPDFLCRTADGRGYSEVLHHVIRHRALPANPGTWRARLSRAWRLRHLPTLERQVQRALWNGRVRAYQEFARRGVSG